MRSGTLEDSLRKKLEELIKDSLSNDLAEATQAVLDSYNYRSDEHRNELRMQELEVSGDVSSMTTLTEPAHPYNEARRLWRDTIC
jgi:hypothetical protein